MKRKLLLGLIGNVLCLSAIGQTITAPTGQPLNITNNVEVSGNINVPSDSSFKIGGKRSLGFKNTNLSVGPNAGNLTATGQFNVFIGENAGTNNGAGTKNMFLGSFAGNSNTLGAENIFLGTSAGRTNSSGVANTFIGAEAGYSNQSGSYNLFLGSAAGFSTTASQNTILGAYAGNENTIGANNSFIGVNAGRYNIDGQNNVFIGLNSGIDFGDASFRNTSGSANTYIGVNAKGKSTISNATAIGANAAATLSNTLVLGNAATTITGIGFGAGVSGLRFANITSASSATSVGGNKVLSVDGSGNVILVALTTGTINSVGGPVAEKTWKEQDGYLYNNSTNGVVINGTGLDGNSLIVKGGVLSKEVNVKVEGSESWPDYVFKPSYKRMSLEDVEKFIKINGHLPNVASATEMAATGNNLNKTDIKLLEKVEELTLYLLEMKKSNEAQNAEIQNLKKQVKSLRRK